MPKFTLTLGANALSFEKNEARFGRTNDNDVVVADALASRSHARVFTDGPKYFVEDLGSGNGTRLNGVKLTAPVELKNGDTISIGDTHYAFSCPPPVDQTMPVPPPADLTVPPSPSASQETPLLPALQDPNATMLKPPASLAALLPADPGQTNPNKIDPTQVSNPVSEDSTVLKNPVSVTEESTVLKNPKPADEEPPADPNATLLKPPAEFVAALEKKYGAASSSAHAKVEHGETRDVAPAMTAAEKARERREAQKTASGRLGYAWKQLPKSARTGITVASTVFALGLAGAVAYALWPEPVAQLAPEPTELVGGAQMIEASFGLGEGVTYVRRDAKIFDFNAAGATRLIGVLHYQARDISKDEVSITLNGFDLGFVPPDTLDVQRAIELVLPAAQVKKGEPNRLSFDNVRNPPGDEAWRISNLWLEIVAIPDVGGDELLAAVTEDMTLAARAWDQREIGPENSFRAWKAYRDAWLKMESMPGGRPEAQYNEARLKMREIGAALDARCSTIQLEVVKIMGAKRPDYELARSTLHDALNYYPSREHRCHGLIRALLDDVGGPL